MRSNAAFRLRIVHLCMGILQRRHRRQPKGIFLAFGILLVVLSAHGGAGRAASTALAQQAGVSQLLTSQTTGVAVLAFPSRPSQPATLREPLVVFFEGDAPAVELNQQVGWVASARQAAALMTTPCSGVNAPAGLTAVCLTSPDLVQIGAYAGAAHFPLTDAAGAEKTGDVAVSIVVQNPLWLFLLLAVVGTVLSIFATWFVSEYQAVRRLRSGRSEFGGDTECAADASKFSSPLKLTGWDDYFKANGFDALQPSGIGLWLKSLTGSRPDYKQLNGALDKAHETLAQFKTLCALRDKLHAGRGALTALSNQIGSGRPRLVSVIDEAIFTSAAAPQDAVIAVEQASARLEEWNQLLALVSQWNSAAGHLKTLCDWRKELTGDPCDAESATDADALLPDELSAEELAEIAGHTPSQQGNEPTSSSGQPTPPPTPAPDAPASVSESQNVTKHPREAHETCCGLTVEERVILNIKAARAKLQAVTTTTDFAVLQPERNIQAVWLALQELEEQRHAQSAGAHAAFALVMGNASPTAGAPILDLSPILQRARELFDRISPVLNGAVILALAGVSLAATVLIGYQALYLDKPWGAPWDFLVLVLLGGGIHSGMAGVAAIVMSGAKKEAQ